MRSDTGEKVPMKLLLDSSPQNRVNLRLIMLLYNGRALLNKRLQCGKRRNMGAHLTLVVSTSACLLVPCIAKKTSVSKSDWLHLRSSSWISNTPSRSFKLISSPLTSNLLLKTSLSITKPVLNRHRVQPFFSCLLDQLLRILQVRIMTKAPSQRPVCSNCRLASMAPQINPSPGLPVLQPH